MKDKKKEEEDRKSLCTLQVCNRKEAESVKSNRKSYFHTLLGEEDGARGCRVPCIEDSLCNQTILKIEVVSCQDPVLTIVLGVTSKYIYTRDMQSCVYRQECLE